MDHFGRKCLSRVYIFAVCFFLVDACSAKVLSVFIDVFLLK